MKKILTMAVVAGFVAISASAWAGGACCSMGKKGDAAKQASMCEQVTAKLELTADQKTKVEAIQAECQKAGSSKEACGKAKDEIRALLTAEQQTAFDAAWEKCAAGGKGTCGG